MLSPILSLLNAEEPWMSLQEHPVSRKNQWWVQGWVVVLGRGEQFVGIFPLIKYLVVEIKREPPAGWFSTKMGRVGSPCWAAERLLQGAMTHNPPPRAAPRKN